MSGVFPSKMAGINVWIGDFDNNPIEKSKNLLAGIEKGFQEAMGSAVKRTGTSAIASAGKEIRSEYFVKTSDFKEHTRAQRKIVHSNGISELAIEFSGTHIPLINFDSRIGKDGRIVVRVKRGSARQVLDHAFYAQIGGRYGIFERETEERIPTKDLKGPSTTQMMSYNEGLKERIGTEIQENFRKRLEHETMAILNGWRKK